MKQIRTPRLRRFAPTLCILIGGCMMRADESAKMAPAEEEVAYADMAKEGYGAGAAPASAAPASPERKMKKGKARPKRIALDSIMIGGKAEAEAAPTDDGDGAAAAPTRSWFPETFLFEPAVLTDDRGRASVDVRVPDRLTTWRVLALAHSRAGAQAGTVTEFRSSLPVYVDPVLPAFLYVGDEVEIPVQVVNTTEAAVRAPVEVSVDRDLATRVRGGGEVVVPAGRSAVQMARVRADRPGTLMFRAGLRGKDAVEKRLPIQPLGRPMSFEKGGTLGGSRTVNFTLPDELEAGATRLVLAVYPGALGLLRAELSSATARQGVAEDAYALLLAGRGEGLLKRLGAEPDADAFRKMELVAAQRIIRHARSPSPENAALLAEAALAHPDNPVLARLGTRLSQQVARAQRPDGTFGGGSGWPIRRLMVATAEGVAAVRAGASDESAQRRADAAALRASGAFERYAGRVDDAYTAAWAIASGAVQGSLRDRYLEIVREAIVQDDSGARRLPTPKGALRADGSRPSDVECTAVAALALLEDAEAKAWLPDLGATLMTRYRPAYGWGDGRANLLALRAVTQIFSEPLPEQFRLRVAHGDDVWIDWKAGPGYADGPYTTGHRFDGAGGPLELTLTPEPAIPGMAFAVTVNTHVPWDASARTPGLELQVDVGGQAKVGRPLDVTLRALVPAGRSLSVRHALPAGVVPDTGSLSRLVVSGQIQRFSTEDGAVTMHLPRRKPGAAPALTYTVVPTLAGRLHAGASKLSSQGRETWVPPSVWTVR